MTLGQSFLQTIVLICWRVPWNSLLIHTSPLGIKLKRSFLDAFSYLKLGSSARLKKVIRDSRFEKDNGNGNCSQGQQNDCLDCES